MKQTSCVGMVCIILLGCVALTHAQVPEMVNYQGRVVVGNTNFNGSGSFKFALVDGGTETQQQASALPVRAGSFIVAAVVTNGGAGYGSAPGVTFVGGTPGTPATGHSLVSAGIVTTVIVDTAGTGYTNDPTVVIDGPPVSVSYVTLWSNDGTSSGGSEPTAAVTLNVSRGLFSVLLGDDSLSNMTTLPPSVFTNGNVNLRVWFDDGVSGFQQLTPDQRLVSAPYALKAAGTTAGAITTDMLSDGAVQTDKIDNGAVTGDKLDAGSVSSLAISNRSILNVDIAFGAVDSSLVQNGSIKAEDLDTATFSNTFWKLDGNSGTSAGTHFIGTMDDQPLELRVSNTTAVRIAYAGGFPNLVLGSANNSISTNTLGSSILGGKLNEIDAASHYSVISGGAQNYINTNNDYATIGGGSINIIMNDAWCSVIGGGIQNYISQYAVYAIIGGGQGNQIWPDALRTVISGGYNNIIDSSSAESTIGGGSYNRINPNAIGSTIGGGVYNNISSNADMSAIGGGSYNDIGEAATNATISGGTMNSIGDASVFSIVAGGYDNMIGSNCQDSAILGGLENTIYEDSDSSSIVGGYQNIISTNSDKNVIGGGNKNIISNNSDNCVIAGGYLGSIEANSSYCSIGGGRQNIIELGDGATIAGGYGNSVGRSAYYATIGGGINNSVGDVSPYSTVSGGTGNDVGNNASYCTIPGGRNNNIYTGSTYSVIIGGYDNEIGTNVYYGIILGGVDCVVNGNYGVAAGKDAKSLHDGAVVWADESTSADVVSTNDNSWTIRAAGGVRIFSDWNQTLGVSLSPNGTGWNSISDRNKKTEIVPISGREVLERLAGVPVSEWQFRNDPDGRRYWGPMAQDFHAAFGLGEPLSINSVDADGVALSAIQGLYEIVQDLKTENLQLRKRVEELEGARR